MGIVIIGGGLAGLATAIKLKEEDPKREIVVVEKIAPESNAQLSGQRYRARVSGQGFDPEAEIANLLASRNEGYLTPAMKEFSVLATAELEALVNRGMPYEDRSEWFGPQFGITNSNGSGRGRSVLDFLKTVAFGLDVGFYKAEARKLIVENDRVAGIIVRDKDGVNQTVEANHFILAGGSLGGRLFHSTNKDIHFTPQELAYNAGIPLVDSTLHMIHPFGNSTRDGVHRIGCYETDELGEAEVFFPDGEQDKETTSLLQEHKAHYAFPEISERFMKKGGVVMMRFPDGSERSARVSYHYSHIAVDTDDGIRVRGVDNLFAVGDASGLGFWTEHQVRFPGFALTKCLVDAEVCRQLFESETAREPIRIEVSDRVPEENFGQLLGRQIKDVNTKHLFNMMFDSTGSTPDKLTRRWVEDLMDLQKYGSSELLTISIGMADAHNRRAIDPSLREPLEIASVRSGERIRV